MEVLPFHDPVSVEDISMNDQTINVVPLSPVVNLDGSPKKKRGRPIGSKNKPKVDPLVIKETATVVTGGDNPLSNFVNKLKQEDRYFDNTVEDCLDCKHFLGCKLAKERVYVVCEKFQTIYPVDTEEFDTVVG